MVWCHPSPGTLLHPTGTQPQQGSRGRQRKHFVPTPSSPHTPQSLLSGKVSKLPSEALTLRWEHSEEPIPLNGFGHIACNARPWASPVQQPTRGLQMELGREYLIIVSWLYFSNGPFLVNRQHQGCHPPFAVPAFPKEKMVETCVRQLVPPPSSYLDTSVALAAAAKMWAHSLNISRQLPDSGSYNARRMADDFMPAESNTL